MTTFADKLKEENIDLNDKEFVHLLQRFWLTAFDSGMHAVDPNKTHYEKVFVEALPKIKEFLEMCENPYQLTKLMKGIEVMESYWRENLYKKDKIKVVILTTLFFTLFFLLSFLYYVS